MFWIKKLSWNLSLLIQPESTPFLQSSTVYRLAQLNLLADTVS